jgi:GcrA cell cycle regulator
MTLSTSLSPNAIPLTPPPSSALAGVAAQSIVPLPAGIPPAAPPRAPRANPTSSPTSNPTWTAERIERLRSCVAAGMTCSEIGTTIGVSRNAVIGKIHRLGLSSGRPAGAQARANCPPRARHSRGPTQRRLLRLAYARASLGEEVMFNVAVASVHPCSFADIRERQCRWPIGDPAAADFVFCGNESIDGFSYCVGHARMAYRAPASRR